MYASFLNLPVEGRHSRALHLELFTVPSTLTTFYEGIKSPFEEQIQITAKNEDNGQPSERNVQPLLRYGLLTLL